MMDYKESLQRIRTYLDTSIEPAGVLSQVLGHLKYEHQLFWCGIYSLKNNGLVLNVFQGMPACTHIEIGRGVCGTAASEKTTQIVDDVSLFPGYIACHVEAKSEIVVPFVSNGLTKFVLDVDSERLAAFDSEARIFFEEVVELIAPFVVITQ